MPQIQLTPLILPQTSNLLLFLYVPYCRGLLFSPNIYCLLLGLRVFFSTLLMARKVSKQSVPVYTPINTISLAVALQLNQHLKLSFILAVIVDVCTI